MTGTLISVYNRPMGDNQDLLAKHCVPCEGGTPPLASHEIEHLLQQVQDWHAIENHKIRKEFRFKDFEEVMRFVNKVAGLANMEGHHPDMHVSYSRVVIELWTHAIGGLSENDFILAAKIDSLYDHE